MNEEWYKCKNYPGFSINKKGDLKNDLTGKLMKRSRSNDEVNFFYSFNCNGKVCRKQVKLLVAEQFIENPDNKKYVINIDGDPENCCVENLLWSNRQYVSKDNNILDENFKWYPMDNAPNYEINKNGQVRHKIKGNILKPTLAKDGYLYYTIGNYNGKVRRYAVHILVARQFLPNPDNKSVVNHIDENRQNCKLENLEWVSHKENSRHATSQDRIRKTKEKPINEYDLQGTYIRTWRSAKAFYEFYNINACTSHISGAVKNNSDNKNRMETTYGRIFTYYTGSKEDIYVNCSSKALARATEPFENQDVPNEFLYMDESAENDCIEIEGENYYKQSFVENLKNTNAINEQIIEQDKLIIEQYKNLEELLKKQLAECEQKYEECLQEKNLYQQLSEQQKKLIDMQNEIISQLEE